MRSETRPASPGYPQTEPLTQGPIVSEEEATLVRRCLRGEGDAIRQLVGRFQAEVYGLCARLLNHRHDAEDVTQEVFLRVFRSLRGWDSARPLRPWVMGIAVNRCRTFLSQRSRRHPALAGLRQQSRAISCIN